MSSAQVFSAPDETAAAAALFADGCTDGLPVVVPTPERVARMVLASGFEPDMVLGTVGPQHGPATVEKVAANAVMAGCDPDYFPVVVAAVRAIIDPRFNLAEIQATTHSAAPLLIVNGPARHACGPLQSATGALGHGFRPNLTIGRAVRLVMINLGGGRAGVGDMALLGHPGKIAYCLAEAEEASPFPPLHTSWGWHPDDSTVTAIACEAPHSVLSFHDPDDPVFPDRLLTVLAAGLANPAANNGYFGRGAVVVILNPEHAATLARRGFGRAEIQRELYDRAVNPRGLLSWLAPGIVSDGDPEERMRVVRRPEDIVVLVAGGGGQYSAVVPTWGGGDDGCVPITERVELDQACLLPISS